MNCPRCGSIIEPNSSFCKNCGMKFNINKTNQFSYQNYSNQNNVNLQSSNQYSKNNYIQPNMVNNPSSYYNDVNNNLNKFQANNSFNNNPKKFNFWVVLIPILVIIIVAIISVTLIKIFSKDNENSNETSQGNKNSSQAQSTESNNTWNNYSLVIDESSITLPMKLSDFLNLGFYEMDTYHDTILTQTVEPNIGGNTSNSNVGRLYGLFTNGKTSNIDLLIYNNTDEEKLITDCYITRISFDINNRNIDDFTLGNVRIINNAKKIEAVIGKTKYEDIENSFGLHYQYDNSNVLTYYPDINNDGVINLSDLSIDKGLRLYFDSNTEILSAYNFYLLDTGNL